MSVAEASRAATDQSSCNPAGFFPLPGVAGVNTAEGPCLLGCPSPGGQRADKEMSPQATAAGAGAGAVPWAWGSPAAPTFTVQMVSVPVPSGCGAAGMVGSFPATAGSGLSPTWPAGCYMPSQDFPGQPGGAPRPCGSAPSAAAAAAGGPNPAAALWAAAGKAGEFRYPDEKVVFAAGQYREVRPSVPQAMLLGGTAHFHAVPARLPPGLQLDPATGIIWGTPAEPPAGADPLGDYQSFQVVMSSAMGMMSAQVSIKVVHFQPEKFDIKHVSQVAKNKYVVLLDAKQLRGNRPLRAGSSSEA